MMDEWMIQNGRHELSLVSYRLDLAPYDRVVAAP